MNICYENEGLPSFGVGNQGFRRSIVSPGNPVAADSCHYPNPGQAGKMVAPYIPNVKNPEEAKNFNVNHRKEQLVQREKKDYQVPRSFCTRAESSSEQLEFFRAVQIYLPRTTGYSCFGPCRPQSSVMQ